MPFSRSTLSNQELIRFCDNAVYRVEKYGQARRTEPPTLQFTEHLVSFILSFIRRLTVSYDMGFDDSKTEVNNLEGSVAEHKLQIALYSLMRSLGYQYIVGSLSGPSLAQMENLKGNSFISMKLMHVI